MPASMIADKINESLIKENTLQSMNFLHEQFND